jgi:hypothetical protein
MNLLRSARLLALAFGLALAFAAVERVEAGITIGLHLEKLVNGQDADSAPGPTVTVGSTVTFTYIVTNEALLPIANITVRDNNGTPGVPGDDFSAVFVSGDGNNNSLLDTSETWTYTASRTAILGQYTNIGSASGFVELGDGPFQEFATDPGNYFGVADGRQQVAEPALTVGLLSVGLAALGYRSRRRRGKH